MPPRTPDAVIGEKVRDLRKARHLSQLRLAALLGISQGYLSKLESGNASFSARQLLFILKYFNVPIDFFAPQKSGVGSQIQNALAREGANHLIEDEAILPSDRLKTAVKAIREALVSADSSRQLTAIAPVLVVHAGQINLSRLRNEFRELGLENRFNWAIESTLEAIKSEGSHVLPREWRLKYRRAALIIDSYFATSFGAHGVGYDAEAATPADVLDAGITSPETLREVSANLSPIARKWRVITTIELDDFIRALRAARGAD
jgi:transcriptional regulator with XRE-family HTH domain